MTRKRSFFTAAAASAVLLGLIGSAIAAPTAPDSLSGLSAWFRAEDITGVADGGTIDLWVDSGPSGIDMIQSNTANMPIWVADSGTGFPAVSFAGNDYMTAGDTEVHGTGGFTAVALFQPRSTTGYFATKFDFGVNPWRQWRFGPTEFEMQETADSWDATNSTWNTPWLTTPLNYLEPAMFAGRWTPGVESAVYVNGQLAMVAANPAATTNDTPSIFTLGSDRAGAADFLNGYVSEVAFYNRALSDSELAGIQEYFTDKYSWTPFVPPDPTQPDVIAGFNFESAATGAPLPLGWVTDTGGTYQTRGDLTYGWSKDMSHQTRAATGDQVPPVRDFTDGRFDTVIHTSDNGQPASWEIDVPNGRYWVRGVFGEPRVGSIRGDLMATFEDTLFTDRAPSNNPVGHSQWLEHWGRIEVTDGKLTVGSLQYQIGENLATGEPIFGQLDSKMALLQVQSANVPDIAINFQRESDMNLAGIHADIGAQYGLQPNGLTYGWLDRDGFPASNASQTRNRGTTNVPVGFEVGDPRFTTLCHMYDMSWEIELENGTYGFVAIFGEPQPGNWSVVSVDIEGLEFHDPDYARLPDFDLFMGKVEVTDGRFTIDPILNSSETLPYSGEPTDNKIVYLELTRLDPPASSAVPEPGTVVLSLCLVLAAVGLRSTRRS